MTSKPRSPDDPGQDRSLARRSHYLRAMGLDLWQTKAIESAIDDAGELNLPVGDLPGASAPVPERISVTPPLSSLADIAARVRDCHACELHAHRRNTVFGVGQPSANWMFIGEAPGAQEDRQGEPFVGAAGKLLNAILQALQITREEVYIANVLKCRPPDNRDPMGEEVRRCEPYLLEQIALIQPKIIIAMGRFAAQSLLRSSEAISRLRGRVHHYQATELPLIVTYHPAYLLRNPVDKAKVWDDLILAKNTLAAR